MEDNEHLALIAWQQLSSSHISRFLCEQGYMSSTSQISEHGVRA